MRIIIPSEPVDHGEIQVKSENIIHGLGVPGDHAEEYVLSLIDELIASCLQMCKPMVSASIFDHPEISRKEGILSLGQVTFNLNKVVTTALNKSTSVALFTATCGGETGAFSASLIKEGNALEGLIVDLIGSEIAEEAAEYVHGRLGAEMALMGLNVTNRYSPGYCNWPVSDQHKLFGLLNGNNSGIKLTDSSLMLPIKSVSGIIGIGHAVTFRGYSCRYCSMDQCLYRNRK